MNRREALGLITVATGLPIGNAFGAAQSQGLPNLSTAHLLNPRQFGALGDGKTLDSRAINAAIDACTKSGGGVVYCSPGRYLCGTVELKTNVTLYLEAGAVILGSTDVAEYTLKPGPDPSADAGQGHLIYARDVENVGIVGAGKIDGQGQAFWVATNRKPVPESSQWSDARHLDWKPKARISPMVELVNCTNLRLEGIELVGASGWTLRPINCTRVYIQGISIRNPAIGPNTDGIDLTGCQNVAISDCLIDTGDDAICLKSENPYGESPRLSKNITVTNCIITSSTNGFKIGTATQGGFENITFSNSTIVSSDPDIASRMVAGIAVEMVDGGWIDGIVVSGIQIEDARAPLLIRRGNRSNKYPSDRACLKGVLIEGIHATGAILTSSITGIPGMEVEDVRISEFHVDTVMPGKKEWVPSGVPEFPAAYPQSRMFGWLPASGLYCRHVRGLSLNAISFTAPADEWRATVIFNEIRELELHGFKTTSALAGVSPLVLTGVQDAWISRAVAPAKSVSLAKVDGAQTSNILISACDVREAGRLTDTAADVQAEAVRGEFNIMKHARPI
jgi:hypothetical protein